MKKIVPCGHCRKQIVFLRTARGRTMPVDADTVGDDDKLFDYKKHKSHFADCPAAAVFRKGKP